MHEPGRVESLWEGKVATVMLSFYHVFLREGNKQRIFQLIEEIQSRAKIL